MTGFWKPYLTRCARERDGWDIRINGLYAGRIAPTDNPQRALGLWIEQRLLEETG